MKSSSKTRIIEHPFASLVQGARLVSYKDEGDKIILGLDGFQVLTSTLFKKDGEIRERVRAKRIPLKMTFSKISKLKRDVFFTTLDNYSMADPSRTIAYLYSWRQPHQQDIFYMFGLRLPASADMEFFARGVMFGKTNASSKPHVVERNWSPAPPLPARLVPQLKPLYGQFGGDPVSIHLAEKIFHRRLFVGGIHIQPRSRPQVNAVLNLGEEPSRWAKKGKQLHLSDRAIQYGEGSQGMALQQIQEEADWVIERLMKNQRVLVHCVAGMNRSVTICCAALILLEGLSADAALARVREHHPWAKPDSHHWLALLWLAKTKRKQS